MVQVSRLPEDVREFVLDMREKQIKKGIQNDVYKPRLQMRSHVNDCISISRLSKVYSGAFFDCQLGDYGRIRGLIQAKKKAKESKIKKGDKNNKQKYKYKGDFQTYPERLQDLILYERKINPEHLRRDQYYSSHNIDTMLIRSQTRQNHKAWWDASDNNYSLLKERIKQNPDLPHK